MWRLRRKTERGWHDGFHINKGDEAKGLCDLLNKLERDLGELTTARKEIEGLHFALKQSSMIYDAVTEQRDDLQMQLDSSCNAEELRQFRAELTAATEQLDESRRLAEKYRNLSCDSQDEADETLLPWETTNPNEL
jgi:predicted  nucleic acid-binding Zn-ribbon protein